MSSAVRDAVTSASAGRAYPVSIETGTSPISSRTPSRMRWTSSVASVAQVGCSTRAMRVPSAYPGT